MVTYAIIFMYLVAFAVLFEVFSGVMNLWFRQKVYRLRDDLNKRIVDGSLSSSSWEVKYITRLMKATIWSFGKIGLIRFCLIFVEISHEQGKEYRDFTISSVKDKQLREIGKSVAELFFAGVIVNSPSFIPVLMVASVLFFLGILKKSADSIVMRISFSERLPSVLMSA